MKMDRNIVKDQHINAFVNVNKTQLCNNSLASWSTSLYISCTIQANTNVCTNN